MSASAALDTQHMSETLVTIGRYLDVTEAHIAAGRLQDEGIPVYPFDINHLSANPMLGIGLGGVRLQVPARFEQEARRLLSDQELSDGAQLNYLATGDASEPEEIQDDHSGLGAFRVPNWVKRKKFWVCFVAFDIAFFGLVLLSIWAA
jgi:hypothetical protein